MIEQQRYPRQVDFIVGFLRMKDAQQELATNAGGQKVTVGDLLATLEAHYRLEEPEFVVAVEEIIDQHLKPGFSDNMELAKALAQRLPIRH